MLQDKSQLIDRVAGAFLEKAERTELALNLAVGSI